MKKVDDYLYLDEDGWYYFSDETGSLVGPYECLEEVELKRYAESLGALRKII